MNNMKPTRIVVCAANKYDSGDVFIGIRHFCPIMRQNMQGYDIQLMRQLDGEIQGFVDQYGVFMTREEALVVAKEAGQLNRYRPKTQPEDKLFSEDIY
jgi:hypothetical protein